MHLESLPVFELVVDAAPPVNCIQQSSALVLPLYPRASKKEETLCCVVGLEEKSKTFLDAFSPLYQPGIVEVVGMWHKVLNMFSNNCS